MDRDVVLHDYEIEQVLEKEDLLVVVTRNQTQTKRVVFEGVKGVSRWFGSSQRSIDSIETERCSKDRLNFLGFKLLDGFDQGLPESIVHIEFSTPDTFSVACDSYHYSTD